MAGVSLQEKGWFLSEEGIAQCTQGGKSDAESVIKTALNTDLREIGKGWLPEDINRGRADYVQGPGVLQLQKIRNVSAPKDNEESQFAPRLMKLVLTDGHITCSAVETEVLKDIGSNTAPGSKILLKMTVDVEHGFLLLNNKNTRNLGGRVEKMAEGWELKKKLAKQQRGSYGTEGGPPPFVPFGQRIGNDAYKSSTRRDNFKSLEVNKGDKKVEDNEFEQQRKATIAEAMQAKEDAQSKKFGGVQKQVSNDYDIAKITEMGFKAEEATNALKVNNGNVQQAIEYLLKGGSSDRRPQGGPNRQSNYESGDRRGQGGPNRQSNYESGDRRGQGGPYRQSNYESDRKPQGVVNRQTNYESDRGRGRRDRRDEDNGPPRGRRGRDTDEGDEVSSKPSGPATLFDFLAVSNKIPETKDTKEKPSSGKDSSNRNHFENRERPRTSSGSSDQSNRSKQSVPPRFVNKPKYDQGQNRGQGYYQDDRSQRSREDRPKTAPTDNRRYDNRTQNERNTNEKDRNTSDRNRNYNDRNYNDNRDYKRGGGKTDDRNFKQNDRKPTNYDSRSYSDSYQRQSDNRENSRGNQRHEKASNRENPQSSDSRQKSNENYSNNSSASSRTSYSNGRGEQGRSQNYQGQSSQSHQNQSSANNSYKQDSYSKGGNSQKSQSSYSANNRGGSSQNYNTGSDNYVQNQQTQSGNYRNYNNYPPISSSGGQFQPVPEFVYTEAQQPVQFSIKVGDKVMAKYWEDNLFYEAMIEVMAPNMPTVVVTFTEYGNTEEVMISDIRPYIPQISQQGPIIPTDMSVPPPQVFFSAPPPPGVTGVDDVIQAFGGMEFRRGGGGAAYPKKDNRGQQQLYQPPPQRR
ncbi:tudor domain-containing protein 3-like [Mercenaria mercenaria]|uniref:tudor domain-containing protein 3-like n=1 Tax=Mercenaria mercenaria TaxID=6596 RepID=UPI00234E45E0|nr:tudor domain-containing protein 3-like [Mercenaria mercenaria]